MKYYLPKKLPNGFYEFTCNNPEKFLGKTKAKVKKIVLFNEILTTTIFTYRRTPLKEFYQEYGVIEYKFVKGL